MQRTTIHLEDDTINRAGVLAEASGIARATLLRSLVGIGLREVEANPGALILAPIIDERRIDSADERFANPVGDEG